MAIAAASQRLAWIGRDSASVHHHLGPKGFERGRLDEAIAEFQRSLAIQRTPQAQLGLGDVHASRVDWLQAARAYGSAQELSPGDPVARAGSGRALLELRRTTGLPAAG